MIKNLYLVVVGRQTGRTIWPIRSVAFVKSTWLCILLNSPDKKLPCNCPDCLKASTSEAVLSYAVVIKCFPSFSLFFFTHCLCFALFDHLFLAGDQTVTTAVTKPHQLPHNLLAKHSSLALWKTMSSTAWFSITFLSFSSKSVQILILFSSIFSPVNLK